MPARLIYANLDVEAHLARLQGGRYEALPKRVLQVLSDSATLLRAFAAADNDELRTLLPVDPERVLAVPGLPRPRLTSGGLEPSECPDLAWAETSQVAATVNDRAFCLDVAQELGCALPGARVITSLAELDAVEADAWVVKAPFSAAGRLRYIHSGGVFDRAARQAVQNLLERQGRLVFEPWMDRVDDFGVAFEVSPSGSREILGSHRLLVDDRGGFRGIELHVRERRFRDLDGVDWQRVEAVTAAVGQRLHAAGYHGAVGIDFWRYRQADGTIVLHPLGEINARLTFGRVARQVVDRVRDGGEFQDEETVRILFGRHGEDQSGRQRDILLLDPGRHGFAVWIEPAAE